MEKLNITKGTWSIFRQDDDIFILCDDAQPNDSVICELAGCVHETKGESNAALILEAGNVANETGLTPRELLNQRNELLAELKLLFGVYNSETILNGQNYERIEKLVNSLG